MENLTAITEKIQKLWAQATDKGVTESEAALFTGKVHELLARYNLDLSMVEHREEEGCVEEDGLEARTLSQWQTGLAWSVGRLCLSECFTSSRWSAALNMTTKRLIFVGSRANVAMAKALLSHLVDAVVRMRKDEKKAQGMTGDRRWGNSFDVGCSSRLRARINELITERRAGRSTDLTTTESMALVVVAEQELAKATHAMAVAHPRMRTSHTRSTISSGSGYNAGYAAGNRISLHNQITH